AQLRRTCLSQRDESVAEYLVEARVDHVEPGALETRARGLEAVDAFDPAVGRDRHERRGRQVHGLERSRSPHDLLNEVAEDPKVRPSVTALDPGVEDPEQPRSILMLDAGSPRRRTVPVEVREKKIDALDLKLGEGVKHLDRIIAKVDNG